MTGRCGTFDLEWMYDQADGPGFNFEFQGAPSFGVGRAGVFVRVILNLTHRKSNQEPELDTTRGLRGIIRF
jgi:hypothetical protein